MYPVILEYENHNFTIIYKLQNTGSCIVLDLYWKVLVMQYMLCLFE